MKYKHLKAWGIMTGSFQYYIDSQIKKAEEDNAPIDCIYKNNKGVWETFRDITSEDTKKTITEILNHI